MLHRTLNLGILAHVDAGKTTLTERLLYEAGVIDKLGSVDAGTTQTDTLALERQRGITIRSAVASFAIDDVTVNLIDTPGHPDFIAEVERVLSVLDGAVLVISAVEGVQPQTRILMRALQRLQIPTLVFVNKIDRPGADDVRVLGSIADRLTPAIIPLETAHELGTRRAYVRPADPGDGAFLARLAELLAERDESILAAYVADASRLRPGQLRNQLAAQTQRAVVHPVFFGSAITGAGVEALLAGIAELLPVAAGNPDDPVAATVFKIERGASGEKIAYVRMFSGTIRTRDPLRFCGDACHKVTAIAVFDHGTAAQRASVTAGEVGKLWGLGSIRVGDRIGEAAGEAAHHQFPPPTLESVAVAPDRANGPGLRLALAQLAEQDPLINVRQDDTNGEISVSLYGEVQKEVIQATLADDYGIEVVFRETTPLYIERPIAAGEGVELLHAETNPFLATIGLRLGPGAVDSGIEFRIEVGHSSVPLYVYKTLESFTEHMGDYVRHALQQGLYGWPVSDCVVTLATCSYSVPDGPPSRRGPLSTAADFRKLTPIVLRQALQSAGTVVCEPVERVGLEIPVDAIGVVNATLGRFGASIEAHASTGKLSTVRAVLPTARAHDLQRQLPALTNGEGVLEASFAGYRRVSGPQPARPSRRDQSPA